MTDYRLIILSTPLLKEQKGSDAAKSEQCGACNSNKEVMITLTVTTAKPLKKKKIKAEEEINISKPFQTCFPI